MDGDERGGRYFRELRIDFGGDLSVARSHVKDARALAGYVRDVFVRQGIKYNVQRVQLQDGTEIQVTYNNGLYAAQVFTPTPQLPIEERFAPIFVFDGYSFGGRLVVYDQYQDKFDVIDSIPFGDTYRIEGRNLITYNSYPKDNFIVVNNTQYATGWFVDGASIVGGRPCAVAFNPREAAAYLGNDLYDHTAAAYSDYSTPYIGTYADVEKKYRPDRWSGLAVHDAPSITPSDAPSVNSGFKFGTGGKCVAMLYNSASTYLTGLKHRYVVGDLSGVAATFVTQEEPYQYLLSGTQPYDSVDLALVDLDTSNNPIFLHKRVYRMYSNPSGGQELEYKTDLRINNIPFVGYDTVAQGIQHAYEVPLEPVWADLHNRLVLYTAKPSQSALTYELHLYTPNGSVLIADNSSAVVAAASHNGTTVVVQNGPGYPDEYKVFVVRGQTVDDVTSRFPAGKVPTRVSLCLDVGLNRL